jgi:uncharacterized SAM-binding protein YcdF (DUF218 family)
MPMPMLMTKADNGTGPITGRVTPVRAPGRLRRAGRLLWAVVVIAALVLTAGFFWFIERLPADEVPLSGSADGIVVLTGGASRVSDALELLAAERGRRLLISGVNPATRREEILRLNPDSARVVRCCVDFDHSVNTLGNAIETRRWAREKGFRSLIVVTSSYHMPRAMTEIAYQLPDVALLAFPVVTDKMRAEPWWTSPGTARLLLLEYLKYIFANIRVRLHPKAGE